jgi:type II secretory pathway pseudopilin PulG
MRKRLVLAAAGLAAWIVYSAIQSVATAGNNDSTKCFDANLGPDDGSCEGYVEGLSCGYGTSPRTDCTCVQGGTKKSWQCVEAPVPDGPCDGDADTWQGVIEAPLDCLDDSDCCLVVDDCLGQAQVVPAAILPDAAWSWPHCAGSCGGEPPPWMDVACVKGTCAVVDDGGQPPDPQGPPAKTHCGGLQ